MSRTREPPIPCCPSCGELANRTLTSYGVRDECIPCGLRSWGGKELVSDAVHQARQDCHAKVDPLWKDSSWVEVIAVSLGMFDVETRERIVRKTRRRACKWTYIYIAAMLDLPSREVHMSNQTDISILRRIHAIATQTTPADIRAWAQARGDDVFGVPSEPTPEPQREGPARNRPCPCGSGRKYKKCHGVSDAVEGAGASPSVTPPPPNISE